MENKKVVSVAAAIIFDSDNRVFLAKRDTKQHQGGLWEFPGGKIEASESAEQALKRELAEEIGIDIIGAQAFIEVPFDYVDKRVLLKFFLVRNYSGKPWGKEGQQTAWYPLTELADLTFPEANLVVVEKLMNSEEY